MSTPIRARNLFGNVLSLGGGEILARIAAFFATAYLARVLGPESFGLVGFATAVCSYLALTNLALNDIGTREVAKTPRDADNRCTSICLHNRQAWTIQKDSATFTALGC